jgi:chromosome segregation ATPase
MDTNINTTIDKLRAEFLKRLFQTLREQFLKQSINKWISIQTVELVIPMGPVAEQKQVEAKLETEFNQIQNAKITSSLDNDDIILVNQKLARKWNPTMARFLPILIRKTQPATFKETVASFQKTATIGEKRLFAEIEFDFLEEDHLYALNRFSSPQAAYQIYGTKFPQVFEVKKQQSQRKQTPQTTTPLIFEKKQDLDVFIESSLDENLKQSFLKEFLETWDTKENMVNETTRTHFKKLFNDTPNISSNTVEIVEYQNKILALENKIATLQSIPPQITTAPSDNEKLKASQIEILSLKQENENYGKQYIQTLLAYENIGTDMQNLNAKLTSLSDELLRTKEQNYTYRQTIENQQDKIDCLTLDLTNLKNKNELINIHNNQGDDLTIQNQLLQTQLQDFDNQILKLQRENDELNSTIIRMNEKKEKENNNKKEFGIKEIEANFLKQQQQNSFNYSQFIIGENENQTKEIQKLRSLLKENNASYTNKVKEIHETCLVDVQLQVNEYKKKLNEKELESIQILTLGHQHEIEQLKEQMIKDEVGKKGYKELKNNLEETLKLIQIDKQTIQDYIQQIKMLKEKLNKFEQEKSVLLNEVLKLSEHCKVLEKQLTKKLSNLKRKEKKYNQLKNNNEQLGLHKSLTDNTPKLFTGKTQIDFTQINESDFKQVLLTSLNNLFEGKGIFRGYIEQNQLKAKVNRMICKLKGNWKKVLIEFCEIEQKLIY